MTNVLDVYQIYTFDIGRSIMPVVDRKSGNTMLIT